MRADELKIGGRLGSHKIADITHLPNHTVVAVKVGPRDLVAKFRHGTIIDREDVVQ